MASLEEFGNTISRMGKDAVKKAQDMADVVTLKGKIQKERGVLKETYEKLGELYVEHFAAQPHTDAFRELCQRADASKKTIEEQKAQIRRLQGIRLCESCGAVAKRSDLFCPACGMPLKQDETAEEETEQQSESLLHCKACGAELDEDSRFCPKCGTEVPPAQDAQ